MRILLVFIETFFSFTVMALDVEKKFELQPAVFYRKINQQGLSDTNNSFDFFLFAGAQFQVSQENFRFDLKPELRGLEGNGAHARNSDPAALRIQAPERFMRLRHDFGSNDNWQVEIEKLNLSYSRDQFEISVGRKPFSPGVLKVFQVWNKFSRSLPIAPGPPLVYSSDGAGLRFQKDDWSLVGTTIVGKENADFVGLAEAISYQTEIESHFVIGHWWERSAAGLAFVKDYWGASWRLESLWLSQQSNGTTSESQFGIGVENAFSEFTTGISEFFYQSEGKSEMSEYYKIAPSRFRSLMAQLYNFSQVQIKLTALSTVSAGLLLNINDWSHYFIVKWSYSASENSDYYIEAHSPQGRDGSEFSEKTFVFPNGTSLGAPAQASVGAKFYF